MRMLECECGFVASGDDDTMVAAAQQHAKSAHDVDLGEAEILAHARVLTDP